MRFLPGVWASPFETVVEGNPTLPSVQLGAAGRLRAMLPHLIDEQAARCYARFGFIASPLREQKPLLLLKGVRRWVR